MREPLVRLSLSARAALAAALVVVAAGSTGCPKDEGTDSGLMGPLCGNSVIETGEQCDPPVAGTCTTMCTFIPMCGNGTVEGSEECDPPDGMTCNAMCRIITQTTPNVGAPCVDDSDCNGGTLPGRCNAEGPTNFPGGFCDAPGCTDPSQCPTGSTCVSFTDGSTACYPTCTTSGTDNGGCRTDAANGFAYVCLPLGTFQTETSICTLGCDDDSACATGYRCETTTNVCVPDHLAAAGGTCLPSGGTCEGSGATCTTGAECPQVCNRPAGTCDGSADACLDASTCAPTCNLLLGTCDTTGGICSSSADCTDTCNMALMECNGDPGTPCMADADCRACTLSAGVCANDAGVACTAANQATVCTAACTRPPGACDHDPAVSCLLDTDCVPACMVNPGGCDNGAGACAVDADCVPAIGDACTEDADCPEFAACRETAAFPGGYCTILYCASYPGLPEFTCPAGTFCPAATPFNGGTVNFCTPTCTVNTMDPTGECDANRGDDNQYTCTEQAPDESGTGLLDFFDTDGAAGFCLPCSTYWADADMCPMP